MSRPAHAPLWGLALLLLATPAALAQPRTNLYADAPSLRPPETTAPARAPVASAPVDVGPRAQLLTPYVGGHSNYVAPALPGGYYGGYGYPYSYGRVGGALMGLASYTQAYGQYLNDVQTAKITREQARQATYDTYRKQLQYELDYERHRLTAPKVRAKEKATDLEWARDHAENTEIWAGRTLNILLDSILKSSTPTRGPYISLDDTQLKGINLTDGTTGGNVSLAKDQGKISWPEVLQEEPYDSARDSFSTNFQIAIKAVDAGEMPDVKTLRSLRADIKRLEDKLDDNIKDVSPSGYTLARRHLNKLKDTVKGLSDSRVVKSCKCDWKKNVRTVADLVEYCMKNGLKFGPAVAPGDEPSYTAMYYAMRSYERDVVLARR